MQYLHHPDAGAQQITLEGDAHRYLFKVRRHRAGETVHLRTLNDPYIYHYAIDHLDKKTALLTLEKREYLPIIPARSLHIGWCMVDPKSIEKVLPGLNEMGVGRITFISCARSQKNFRLDFARMEKILLASMQQCGRSEWMKLDKASSFPAFVADHPEAYLLHFSETPLPAEGDDLLTVIIGCEGGFTDDEIALIAPERIVGLDTPMILRSESAAVAVAGKVLL
jgi:16S rRNA (uracil1498-N3)-methyltransferase